MLGEIIISDVISRDRLDFLVGRFTAAIEALDNVEFRDFDELSQVVQLVAHETHDKIAMDGRNLRGHAMVAKLILDRVSETGNGSSGWRVSPPRRR